ALPPVFYDVLDSDALVTENLSNMTKKPHRLERLLPSLVYLAHWSMNLAKESRPIYAFYLPLAGGPLCNAPGLTHIDRAIISWCLMYRHYDDASGKRGVEDNVSEMSPTVFYGVKKMIPGGKDGRKVCEIIGKFLGFITLCHLFEEDSDIPLIHFKVSEEDQHDKIGKKVYNIELNLISKTGIHTEQLSSLIDNPIVRSACKKLEKNITLGHKDKKKEAKKDKKNGYHKSDINISVKN
ncbi:1889_t:CDS:1, partial [Scutellospora calospora]